MISLGSGMKHYPRFFGHIRILKKKDTCLTLFRLTYGHDVGLPMEINIKSLKVTKQAGLQLEEYAQVMF